jgi:hypothetical protein
MTNSHLKQEQSELLRYGVYKIYLRQQTMYSIMYGHYSLVTTSGEKKAGGFTDHLPGVCEKTCYCGNLYYTYLCHPGR